MADAGIDASCATTGRTASKPQIFSDTNELIARRFDTREQAVRWAEWERKDLEKGGA